MSDGSSQYFDEDEADVLASIFNPGATGLTEADGSDTMEPDLRGSNTQQLPKEEVALLSEMFALIPKEGDGSLAQLEEHPAHNRAAEGSKPSGPTTKERQVDMGCVLDRIIAGEDPDNVFESLKDEE